MILYLGIFVVIINGFLQGDGDNGGVEEVVFWSWVAELEESRKLSPLESGGLVGGGVEEAESSE